MCRLPLMPEGEELLPDAEVETIICAKCGQERKSVADYLLFGESPEDVVHEIRFRVEQATGLTCSAGENYFLKY